MKIVREIALLTWRYIVEALRNPIFLFMGVGTPLIYLALFTPLLSTLAKNGGLEATNVLTLFVPGMLPIIAFSTGIFTGFGMIAEARSGIIERFRVTPISRFSILTGAVLFDVCSALFQSLLFIVIALPFGFRGNFLGILLLLPLLGLLTSITSSFGNAIAILVKSEDRYAPIIHGIHLPTLLLSGSLLPMSLAPKWLKIIAHFNPVFYVVEASRALAVGDFGSQTIVQAFLLLIPFASISIYLATGVFRKTIN